MHAAAVVVATAIAVLGLAGPARAAPSGGSEPPTGAWVRPVAGRVVRGFVEPANPYAPGHRGVDLAAPPGTAVRAAGAGTVSFAGDVAGTLHVVVAHANGFRTSYSFLADVAVHTGDAVARGAVLGHAGGSGPEHAVGVLHFGLRVGDRYVDPMQLFRPDDLTELVRLVPAGPAPARPWVGPDRARADLEEGIALRPRSIATPPDAPSPPGGDDGGCGDGIPVIGDAVSAGCDAVSAAAGEVVDWASTSVSAALDQGLALLHAAGEVGRELVQRLRDPLHDLLHVLARSVDATRRALLATPLGQVLSDVVEVGKRFWDWTQRVCSKDAPPADGTGGDGHLLMAVGGIDSHTSGDGTSFNLDTRALGYGKGDVTWFSYAADGGPYHESDTHGDLRAKAALLGQQLRQMARDHPGRPVDLIAHSQGGVVVDWFLVHVYKDDPSRYPPLDTVVTLSSPHRGAPLATAGEQLRASGTGRNLTRLADELPGVPKHPPSDSAAVEQLAEDSPFMTRLFDGGLPAKIHMTSIGATDDVVVPANHIGAPGADEIVVDVAGVSDHHNIPKDPAALRAVRAALEHKPLPCTSLLDGIRSALEPVVFSRVSHDLGQYGGGILKGPNGT
ncbi:MAG TPA: peptidoglycan DD-metalloendopeptidase family protein [Acidimicrobiia bacterium]|nr:peptidoglycan DD-metalloendopeptidase family protein [Acidimicrobiia bacterium]